VETELYLLWDVTVEPDVVELLLQHNFLELCFQIIHESTIPRLMVSGVEYANCVKYVSSCYTVGLVASTELSLVISPCSVSVINHILLT
jgi:hypothetical protein